MILGDEGVQILLDDHDTRSATVLILRIPSNFSGPVFLCWLAGVNHLGQHFSQDY